MLELTKQFKLQFLLIIIVLSAQMHLFSLATSSANQHSGIYSVQTRGLTTLPSHLKNYCYRKSTVADRSYSSHSISTSISVAKARSIPTFANVKGTGFTSVKLIWDSRKNVFKFIVACVECHVRMCRTYIFAVWFYPCKHVARQKNLLRWLYIT